MALIHVLDKSVAELIAAGEVVERPASVVKELCENSIDAKSRNITVEIQNGGITYIRVTDDGCGIEAEDVETAFLRHATSKVMTEDDLDSISTLGFRGEALCSIAAVSKVTMLTRTAATDTGVRAELEGGDILSIEEAGCPVGTTIVIRELFYNTPARMKFLKKDSSEATAVAYLIEKLALSHPEISFRFIRDGREELHTAGNGELIEAIFSVLGKQFAQALLPVSGNVGGVSVSGYITRPEAARSSRNMQIFFLNGRYISTRTGIAALEEGFRRSIQTGRFPGCVIFLRMPWDTVDVNVHPAKTQVRFLNEKTVFDAVFSSVRSALDKRTAPGMTLDDRPLLPQEENKRDAGKDMVAEIRKKIAKDVSSFTGDVSALSSAHQGFTQKKAESFGISQKPQVYIVNNADDKKSDFINTQKTKEPPVRKEETEKPDIEVFRETVTEKQETLDGNGVHMADLANARLIGEVFSTYVIAQLGNEMIVIDKHAAHERLLYEELKKKTALDESQYLVTPMVLKLPREDSDILIRSSEKAEQIGFQIEDYGAGTIAVRAVPCLLGDEDVTALLSELAQSLRAGRNELLPQALDDLLHSVACRSAIKGGDFSVQNDLQNLLRLLSENDEIHTCPHGRPVAFTLSRHELEKKFGRTR